MVAAALFSAACGGSQAAPRAAEPRIDAAALDAFVDRELGPHVPSAVVGLVTRDGVVWHHAVGARDGRGGAPPDRRTAFRIGSLTKLVTALAVAQLARRGVLDLDAPVARWLPELAPALSRGGVDVTLRQLLTHTSGIAPVGDGSASYSGAVAPSEADLFGALHGELRTTPGTAYLYSNAGMALAGTIVSRAAGEPFRDYVQREILDPLGMRGARWDRDAIDVEHRASGMGIGGDLDPPTWQLGAFEPAGGLWADLDDLAELARFALGAHDEVLPAGERARMLEDDPLPGPHGLAWEARPHDGEIRAGHLGSTSDYCAAIEVSTGRGIAAVGLASSGEDVLVGCVASALLDAVETSRSPASCASLAPAELEAAIFERALDGLIAFLAEPTEAGATAAFAPSFLEAAPPAQLLEAARAWTARYGACTAFALSTHRHDGGRATLHCTAGEISVSFQIAREAPHGLSALVPDPAR